MRTQDERPTTADILTALSWARTAISDPGAMNLQHAPETARAYALERIDDAMVMLRVIAEGEL